MVKKDVLPDRVEVKVSNLKSGSAAHSVLSKYNEEIAVAEWDKALIFFFGRGKTLKTTHARIRVENLIRAGRRFIAADLEPINAGLSASFEKGIIRRPGYTIDNGRDLAAYLYPIAEEIAEGGGVGVIDTPGNDRSLVEMGDLSDITEILHEYGVRVVFVVTCGAEADDMALLDRLAAVLKRAPDCLILAVSQKGLPSHFKDQNILKEHLEKSKSVNKLMSGPSAVRFVPICDAIEKLDGKQISLYKASELPLLKGSPLSIFEAGFLNTFLKRYEATFKGLLT